MLVLLALGSLSGPPHVPDVRSGATVLATPSLHVQSLGMPSFPTQGLGTPSLRAQSLLTQSLRAQSLLTQSLPVQSLPVQSLEVPRIETPATSAPREEAARDVKVTTTAELRAATLAARPGTIVRIAPGTYDGFLARDVVGTAERPIRLTADDPRTPPIFRGQIQLSDVAHFVLEHVVVTGAEHNGVNVDDASTFDTPAHHVVLRDVVVRDVGGRGNDDGIKLSGVQDFRIERCTVERWGRGGSAIDMVGCARGTIEDCTFRDGADDRAATGVQAKGGSREITIRGSRFEDAGERAVHLGGSTALEWFRPAPAGFEARDLVVEGNVFVGSTAPVAFTGVDGAVVRFNTIVRPRKWFARILQENRAPGFVACRGGQFTDNLIVYRADTISVPVNVGDATAPETFVFARNYWWCEDAPERAAPKLPVPEQDSAGGADPRFLDAAQGDWRVAPDSPARAHGAHACPAVPPAEK